VVLTSSSIKSPAASFAFEVLGLLMVDEDFLVIKVAFTVITPWPVENLFHVWMAALLLPHLLVTVRCGNERVVDRRPTDTASVNDEGRD
jgi:hypothetical protein